MGITDKFIDPIHRLKKSYRSSIWVRRVIGLQRYNFINLVFLSKLSSIICYSNLIIFGVWYLLLLIPYPRSYFEGDERKPVMRNQRNWK